jgi:hypothetical protein
MSLIRIGKYDVIKITMTIPRNGTWYADAWINSVGEEIQLGDTTVSFPMVDFAGTVTATKNWVERSSVRVVGGKDGWGKPFPGKYYENVPFRIALQDICSAAGETLASSPSGVIDRWVQPATTCGRALRWLLESHPDEVAYRHKTDGSLAVGTEAWPKSTAKLQGIHDFDEVSKRVQLATDDFIYPGTVLDLSQYDAPAALYVESVDFVADADKLRFNVWWDRSE